MECKAAVRCDDEKDTRCDDDNERLHDIMTSMTTMLRIKIKDDDDDD